jgi:hypothetical protein
LKSGVTDVPSVHEGQEVEELGVSEVPAICTRSEKICRISEREGVPGCEYPIKLTERIGRILRSIFLYSFFSSASV